MKSLFVLAVVILSACGGPPKDGPTTPDGKGSGSKPAAAGDVSLDLPTVEIKGIVFEPEALGRPGMPIANSKNPRATIAIVKAQYAGTKAIVDKQAHAAVLATMLFQSSKTQTGQQQKDTVTEARQVLRDVAALAKDQVDDIVLRMLGSYELELEDWDAAAKAWDALVLKLPKDKDIGEHKAWAMYSALRGYKNDAALAAAKKETVSDKQPLLAYAIAWAKWRGGDDTGAWQAIIAAYTGWGTNANKDVVERDVMLFAARSSVPVAQVTPQLITLFGAKQPAQQYELLVKLGERAYQFAGRWTDSINLLEEALKLAGGTVPPNDKVRIKYNIAQFTVPLDQPDAAARASKDALGGLPACTTCKPQEKNDLVVAIYGIARTFHLLYATANDVRFYQPAHDLYDVTVPLIMDPAMRTQAKSDVAALEKTLRNTKAGTGTHEKQAIGVLLRRHDQEIIACYEDALVANPKLTGQLTIELESDATGMIKGASSEPKAGVADMSAVAGCAVTAAKQWKLPKRGMPGNTRIKLVYSLAKK